MRRLGLILALLAGILLLVAGAGIVWLSRTDLAPHLSRIATEQLGREVRIEHATLDPGFPAQLELRGLRIANAEWANAEGANAGQNSAPEMLRLEKLSAAIDLPSLLGGLLRYEKLEVSGLRVVLERNSERQGNWRFPGLTGGEASDRLALVPANRTQFPDLLDFVLRESEITYRTSSGQTLRIGLREANIRARDAQSPVLLKITGSYNDMALRLQGRTAPFAVLRDATRPFEAAFTAEGDSLRADFGGLVDKPLDFDAVQGRLSIEARLLSSLLRLFGSDTSLPLSASVVGGLSRNGDKWRLDDLHGAIEKQDVSGMLALTEGAAGQPDAIEAVLTMPELVLDPLLAALPEGKEPASLRLDTDPAAAHVSFTLDAARLHYGGWRLGNVSTAARLAPGEAELQRFAASLAGGRLQASGKAEDEQGKTHLIARAALADARAGEVAMLLGAKDEPIAGRVDSGLFIEMQGATWAEALRISRGHLVATMDEGRIDRSLLEQASTDLRALFRDREGKAPLDCLLVVGTLQNGQVAVTPLRLRAPRTELTGGGIVDLMQSKLDLVLRSSAKASGFFALDVPLRFQGAFSDIKVRPSTAKAAVPALDAQIAIEALPPDLQQLATGSSCRAKE